MSVEITDNTEEVKAALKAAVQRALERIGLRAERYAIQNVPVDTSNLKQSIKHMVVGDEVYIGTIGTNV